MNLNQHIKADRNHCKKLKYYFIKCQLLNITYKFINKLLTSDNVNFMLPFCSGSLPSKIAEKKENKNH